MDTLTFGTPVLLKHLTFSEQKKMPVHEVNFERALSGLEMDKEQVRPFSLLHRRSFSLVAHLPSPLSLVHRLVHSPRLRLPRPNQRYRSQDRSKTSKRARHPRKSHRASQGGR